jgi:hypothetical protein
VSPSRARLVIGAIAVVAAIEWMASARVYRDRIDDADWAAAREAVAAIPETDAVVLATPWLGPRARMEIPALAERDAVARPDLHGVTRLHVLGLDDAWSAELDDDLDGLVRPEPRQAIDVGPFTLTTYALPGARVLADWADTAAPMQVRTPSGACRGGRGAAFRCSEGTVTRELAEIDYRPRACLSVALGDGISARIRQDRMPLGDTLRGHLGFHDYNGRIRNDTPARVVVRIDDAVVARFLVADTEGWRAFVVPTTPGTADVEVEVTVGVQPTWGKNGIDNSYPRHACLELRSLQEAG